MKWYYYLHTNGELISKNPIAYNSSDFNESPFVKCYWEIDTEDRGDAWKLVIEALARGAKLDKIKELATKWKLTKEDLKEYILRNIKPTEEQKDGMDKFTKQILNEEPNVFWDKLKKEKITCPESKQKS